MAFNPCLEPPQWFKDVVAQLPPVSVGVITECHQDLSGRNVKCVFNVRTLPGMQDRVIPPRDFRFVLSETPPFLRTKEDLAKPVGLRLIRPFGIYVGESDGPPMFRFTQTIVEGEWQMEELKPAGNWNPPPMFPNPFVAKDLSGAMILIEQVTDYFDRNIERLILGSSIPPDADEPIVVEGR